MVAMMAIMFPSVMLSAAPATITGGNFMLALPVKKIIVTREIAATPTTIEMSSRTVIAQSLALQAAATIKTAAKISTTVPATIAMTTTVTAVARP